MRPLSLLPLLLVACETTPSSGNPFAPAEVAVQAPADGEGGAPDAEESDDSRFAVYDDLVEISSEELSGGAAPDAGESGDDDPEQAEEAAEGVTDAGADGVADAVSSGVAENAVSQMGANSGAGMGGPGLASGGLATGGFAAAGFGATGWPLRLVATTPNAQPPRAILGLPDGQELVVRPGAMVPELGVVVMSVGAGSVEVARIVPAGDHAMVQSQTLTAQF